MSTFDLRYAAILGAMGVLLALPFDAWAQGRGRGGANGPWDKGRTALPRGEDAREARSARRHGEGVRVILEDGRVIVVDERRPVRRARVGRRGKGPKFCRSGAGHPVHGRSWCVQKGLGLGVGDGIFFQDGRLFLREDDVVRILLGHVLDDRH